MLVAAVIIGVLCAILCYMIAKGKDRDVTWFVVGGLLLGPIGVIVALAARREDEVARTRLSRSW